MPRIAVVLIGHYRSFDLTHKKLKETLSSNDVDFFLHTWSTQDASTKSHHGEPIEPPPDLTVSQINLLKSFDPKVQIETQFFTEEDLSNTTCGKPVKAIVYLFEALQKTLRRINPDNYDYVFVSRYDVLLNNFRLPKFVSNNEIQIGIWDWHGKTYVYDVVYAFTPKNISKFIDLDFKSYFEIHMPECMCIENIYLIFYQEFFEKITRKWHFDKNFSIIRTTGLKSHFN